ncbi:unnamed protein product [Coregonus sp. 'balchen']|nr:unnamed protein product [Coregonus sp. 'balchen']
MSEKEIGDFMFRKAVVLKYAKNKKEKKKKKRTKGLNAKQRREMKVFQLKPEHQKYELFLPLHELWKQYIRDLCNGLKPERSKCPSYVGTTGILVQEMKLIPKRNSVFALEIDGFVSHIYGSKFELRSSERSAKTFKVKGTIDL